MSVFVNRNINGKWQKIEVSDTEVAAIEKTHFLKNVDIAKKIVDHLPKKLSGTDPLVINALIPVLVEKMASPLYYAIENFVDSKLTKETVDSL